MKLQENSLIQSSYVSGTNRSCWHGDSGVQYHVSETCRDAGKGRLDNSQEETGVALKVDIFPMVVHFTTNVWNV